MAGFWDRLRGAGNGSDVFSVRDLADRTASRENQQRRDEAQREIVEALPVPVVISSRLTSRLLYANPPAVELFGWPPDQMGNYDVRSGYADPSDRQKLVDAIAAGGGRAIGVELRLKRADGTLFWGLVSASRLRYRGEEAVIATTAVIDQRKQLEEQLTQSESQLRAILESAPVAVAIIGRGGKPLFWNAEFARQLGMFTKDDPRTVDTRLCYRDDAQRQRITDTVRRYGSIRNEEIEAIVEDGSSFWGIASMERVVFQGEHAAVTWVVDITERKRAEALVRQKEEQLRDILEASPIGVMIAGRGGRHLYSNSRWRELGGVRDDQVDNFDVRVFFQSEADRKRVAKALDEQGRVRDLEIEVRRMDGQPLWLLLTMERVTWEGQAATLSWYYDYSERKRAAEELQQSRQALQAVMDAVPATISVKDRDL